MYFRQLSEGAQGHLQGQSIESLMAKCHFKERLCFQILEEKSSQREVYL